MSTSSSVKQVLLIAAFTVVVASITLATILYVTRDRNPIPTDVRASLVFSPLTVPKDHASLSSTSYALSLSENGTQILTNKIIQNDTEILVSQYVQPSEFTDIPEYKDRFLTNVVRQQQVVQTSNGPAYIGSLERDNGSQIVVLLENGLIVLMKPSKPLEQSDWRRIIEALELRRVE